MAAVTPGHRGARRQLGCVGRCSPNQPGVLLCPASVRTMLLMHSISLFHLLVSSDIPYFDKDHAERKASSSHVAVSFPCLHVMKEKNLLNRCPKGRW